MKSVLIRKRLKSFVSNPELSRVADGLINVEKFLIDEVCTKAPGDFSEKLKHTINSGGKRLRPILVLLCGNLGNFDKEKLVTVASSVEIIHTASLIHDDVIDNASLRRGSRTIQSKYGKQHAISAGDFLFARAFELISELGDPELISIFTFASNQLSLGELDGHFWRYTGKISEKNYLRLIKRKTAALFSAACRAGAYLSGANRKDIEAVSEYGENLGLAFQLYDDLLDIIGNEKNLGKPAGADLSEGFITFPYLITLRNGENKRDVLRAVKGQSSKQEIKELISKIKKSDVIEITKKTANKYVDRAVGLSSEISNENIAKSLESIGYYVTERYA